MESETILPPKPSDEAAPFDPSAAVPDEYDVLCEGCGYSLVGIQSDRCPECGKIFEPRDLPFARVPWLHRRKIGRLRAYVRTYRMVVYHPRQFAEELCRPVRISNSDARQFRRMSVYIATAGVAGIVLTYLGFIAVIAYRESHAVRGQSRNIYIAATTAAVVFATFVPVFHTLFRLMTDLPLFIWKGHPSLKPTELAPIQSYAAAPLAIWIYLPVLNGSLLVAGYLIDIRDTKFTERTIELLIAAVLGAWLLILMSTTLRLMLGAGVERRRVRMMAAYLPLHWVMMGFVSLAGGGLFMALEANVVKWLLQHLWP